jgi:hypothetical protein
MRAIRNLSFVVLVLVCWAGPRIVAEGQCISPGLFGYGETEEEALQSCHGMGENHCSAWCWMDCGVYSYINISCTAYGPPWTAGGTCICYETP